MTMVFESVTMPDDLPQDSVPDLSDVEYPCVVCGQESGPYGGRGRKPKFCPEHKKSGKVASGVKVTGSAASLAAQATAVLVQLNGMMALGAMGLQMHQTAHAIAAANPTFEQQAHNALLTDTELCRLILKSGAKSAKLSLAFAYVGFGMAILPTAVVEAKERQAVRKARKEENDDTGA